jgi:hypothetical protein
VSAFLPLSAVTIAVSNNLYININRSSIPHSDRTFEHIRTLATRHPRTKFVSIVGDKCIPNLPDTRIPMIIAYRKGDIKNQLVAWGADIERRVEGIFSSSIITLL